MGYAPPKDQGALTGGFGLVGSHVLEGWQKLGGKLGASGRIAAFVLLAELAVERVGLITKPSDAAKDEHEDQARDHEDPADPLRESVKDRRGAHGI
jgi:hypothetical protein